MSDQKAIDEVKGLYRRKSNQHGSQREALLQREGGPGAPLKKYHNTIKRQLINHFTTEGDTLLDFACGRGGDLRKWFDRKLSYVKGIDLADSSIEEAKGRLEEAKPYHRQVTEVDFEASDQLGQADYVHGGDSPFDAVSCMFAVHYFFDKETTLHQFLKNVAANLKEGGYFFGTVPDGKKVCEHLGSSHNHTFDTPMLKLVAKWEGDPKPFGSAYYCSIADTVTEGDSGADGSLEYLVYNSVFMGVAKKVGLEPVFKYPHTMHNLFQAKDMRESRLLKQFNPHFPQSDPSLEQASRLFTAFCFKKCSSSTSSSSSQPMPHSFQKRKREHSSSSSSGSGGDGSSSSGADNLSMFYNSAPKKRQHHEPESSGEQPQHNNQDQQRSEEKDSSR
mmetsp:Transcript_1273/g.1718  ORF Transcript_1273/g.1718 Transcript_1273/m.1718 type:complete len:390 (-) Transcript_1273:241-1410(-)|eukprot:CAMPEP_0175099982 /NCGR_PEP_ID=MMETSP0086_2-20121207/6780_1 /TAXON_ID=136419 /ORGANISM="Unknown Unknown, Strain D1" /LENGTH=389 /DNA_ID=CAMNT_0016373935 /DNA_START=96 /DNA_END=1265 /DNA_ORIENTATION=-